MSTIYVSEEEAAEQQRAALRELAKAVERMTPEEREKWNARQRAWRMARCPHVDCPICKEGASNE